MDYDDFYNALHSNFHKMKNKSHLPALYVAAVWIYYLEI